MDQNKQVDQGSGEGKAYVGRPSLFLGHHVNETADRQDRHEKIDRDNRSGCSGHHGTFDERVLAGQGPDIGHSGAGDSGQRFAGQECLM